MPVRETPEVVWVTWAMYRENLEGNLRDLHQRLHRGAYRASVRGAPDAYSFGPWPVMSKDGSG